uniref:Uncharacterized protein n=1 Tax=Anguilla anguilla TaxID=7936 RepID=A0A0E9XE56_ANGAN
MGKKYSHKYIKSDIHIVNKSCKMNLFIICTSSGNILLSFHVSGAYECFTKIKIHVEH